MLFSIFIFGCMQEERIIDKDIATERVVHERQEATTVQQRKESKPSSAPKESIVDKPQRRVPVSPPPTPITAEKPIETGPLNTEAVEPKETVASKEPVESKEVVAPKIVEKKEETPKAKKKVQYSKPNQMCVSRIKKVLRDKNGEISFCYDRQKARNPDLEGSITVQINVHKSRNSIWVKKDTLKDKNFRSCMKSKIRDWDFGSDCYGASFKKSYKLVSG